jgi:hypothetical protein
MWAAVIAGTLIPLIGMFLICGWSGPGGITKNPIVFMAVFLALFGIPVTLVVWWWTRVLKRHGYLVPLVPVSVRRRAWVIAVAGLSVTAGIVALEMLTYAATRSRALELGIAVGVGAPAMFVLTSLGAFTANFAARSQPPIPRFQLWLYPLSFVLFAFNLVMSIQMHGSAELGGLHEVTIAGITVALVTMPFTGYMQWKRYTEQQRDRMLPA